MDGLHENYRYAARACNIDQPQKFFNGRLYASQVQSHLCEQAFGVTEVVLNIDYEEDRVLRFTEHLLGIIIGASRLTNFGESMNTKSMLTIMCCFLVSALIFGQTPAAPQQTGPEKQTVATAIPGVVAAGIKVERVWTGDMSADGLIGMADGTLLLPEQGADRISKVDKNGKKTVFLEDTNETGGIAIDPKGRIIAVERGGVGGSFRGQPPRARTPRLSVLFPKKETLADNFEGKTFGVLADIVADKKGGVYITEPGANSVYYYSPAGKFTRVTSDNEAANGVMLSRDEKTLYVTNGPKGILAYNVQPDGSIKNARLFANPEGGVDGLAIDSEGRVYDCSRLGIQVMSADGKSLGLIPMPRGATTLAFAGPDKKTLYMIGRGHDGPGGDGPLARSMYKVQMLAQGFKGRAK
jgi:gluconolactonase